MQRARPLKIIKLIEEEQIEILVDLYYTIYSTDKITKDIHIHSIGQKPSAKECHYHRTIRLMSQALKMFQEIMHGLLHKKLAQDISDIQFELN